MEREYTFVSILLCFIDIRVICYDQPALKSFNICTLCVLQAYPIGSRVRGLALIIDNERFENNVLPFREGSHIDANNLDILFEQLGFKVTQYSGDLNTGHLKIGFI